MKVLQIAPPWFPVPPRGYGGIEMVVSLLADGLHAAGHDVTLLACGGSRTSARLLTVFDDPRSVDIGQSYPEALHCLAGYAARHDYDVIHDHTGVVGPTLGALLDGPPVVHTLHGPWHPDAVRLFRALPPRLRLVAISADQRRRAPEGVDVTAVVPNGVDLRQFPFDARPRDGDGYLLFLGRANPDKGPDTAVRAARRLGRRLVMGVKVNEPPERDYWEREVVPLLGGADVDVRFQVDTHEKGKLLAGADAVLFPVRWPEPFGLVMAEAMACGTPVVAFADGAAAEVVADRETGFVLPPGDLDAFCQAVSRVHEIDPRACRRRVEERFSSEAMVRGYEQVYERALSDAAPRTPAAAPLPATAPAPAALLAAPPPSAAARLPTAVP